MADSRTFAAAVAQRDALGRDPRLDPGRDGAAPDLRGVSGEQELSSTPDPHAVILQYPSIVKLQYRLSS